ncbi:hypothetical protein KXV85_004981, partial [Aspergillus fumigatus]
LGELGVVPASGPKALWDWWATNPSIDVAAIDAKEAILKHDVIAFLDWVAEQVGPEARFMHQGMTSSDVLDTTLAVQLARAADILIEDIDALLAAIGGPQAVTRWLRRNGIGGIRLDRDIATMVRDDGEVDPARKIDLRDSTTPQAMAVLLAGLYQGQWLSPSSREVLLGAMA